MCLMVVDAFKFVILRKRALSLVIQMKVKLLPVRLSWVLLIALLNCCIYVGSFRDIEDYAMRTSFVQFCLFTFIFEVEVI